MIWLWYDDICRIWFLVVTAPKKEHWIQTNEHFFLDYMSNFFVGFSLHFPLILVAPKILTCLRSFPLLCWGSQFVPFGILGKESITARNPPGFHQFFTWTWRNDTILGTSNSLTRWNLNIQHDRNIYKSKTPLMRTWVLGDVTGGLESFHHTLKIPCCLSTCASLVARFGGRKEFGTSNPKDPAIGPSNWKGEWTCMTSRGCFGSSK